MSEPIISICCAVPAEIISYHVFKMDCGAEEIIDTSYRCPNCGHVFHIWSDGKLAPEEKNEQARSR
jgi:DNA-directed RNA polymerase subunit RPC12/RpoP